MNENALSLSLLYRALTAADLTSTDESPSEAESQFLEEAAKLQELITQ